MDRFLRHRRAIVWTLTVALVLCATSCGTILYPERRGQPAGPLDLKVVALDAIGLFFFFVPGVIAFAVDFSTGAIYLPPHEYMLTPAPAPGYSAAEAPPADGDGPALATYHVDPDELSTDRLEEVLSAHVGRPVRLDAATLQRIRVEHPDELRELIRAQSPHQSSPVTP
jgi:hypothetical protein